MNVRATAMTDVAGDVIALTKPRITRLVLFTTAVGLWLAPDGLLSVQKVVFALLGTVLVVSAANTLNMYLERDVDGLMERTRNRPLPAGRLAPSVALWLGLGLAAVSVPLLTIAVNPLTGLLAVIALTLYVGIYTPLKQKSWAAVLVGAIPGAIPPLMGWTAATGRVQPPGLALFAIMFLWQVPHTLAITLFRHDDYARAGFQTLPVQQGAQAAKLLAAFFSVILVLSTLVPVPLRLAGRPYLATALILGAGFVGCALWGLRPGTGVRWARGLFVYSIVYLSVLFGVLLFTAQHAAA